jgi:hypothetical protein
MDKRCAADLNPYVYAGVLLGVATALLLAACQPKGSTGGTPGQAPGVARTAAGKPGGSATASAKPSRPLLGRAAEAATGDAAGAKGEQAEPKVEVTGLIVEPPSIDFTGPGRYDVTVEARATNSVKPAVWRIAAFGEDGTEVGHRLLFLVLYSSEPRTLIFNDFFCKSVPVRIEIQWNKDQQADSSGQAEKGGTEPGAGGASKPGGPSTGSGAAPGGGGGGSAPPKSSGDEEAVAE